MVCLRVFEYSTKSNIILLKYDVLFLLFYFAGDIIQENFVDSYNNLTLKTVLMLKWTSRNCAGKGKSKN